MTSEDTALGLVEAYLDERCPPGNKTLMMVMLATPVEMWADQLREAAEELDAFTAAMRALPLNDYFGEFVERMYDAEMLPEEWQPMET